MADEGILGENTKVKLGIVVATIGTVVAGTAAGLFWITSSLQSVKDVVGEKIETLSSKVASEGAAAKLSQGQLDSKLDNLQSLVTVQLGVASNEITGTKAEVKELESRVRALELLRSGEK